MRKYYKAEMDRLLRVLTRVVWALLLLPPVAMGMIHWASEKSPGSDAAFPWVFTSVVLLSAAIACFTKKLAPRGFEVNDIELVIDREMNPVSIPLSSVTELRALDDAEVKGALRLWGASGFYAHYGLFWTRKLGKFRLYSRRFTDLVLVRTEKTLYVLGPDSPAEFLADLRPLLRS
ncbi:MAG: hypothetical protein COT18_05280 [Elusimicrobia bacterium CG08_land_8_20_14_0_20_59_10]|nr:MAG: hypothetical protein COT18_05280 [Elusimicrobia bacterium CG08_land_8_20_14_0_20_59_10]